MSFVKEEATVHNINGFHVRPSTAIAKLASSFKSKIYLYKKNSTLPIDAKSSLDLISSFIVKGDVLLVECQGPDATKAFPIIKEAIEAIYDLEDPHPVAKKS